MWHNALADSRLFSAPFALKWNPFSPAVPTEALLARPQGNLADFYRELGDLFRVPLRPHNRWAGSKTLRERWEQHFETTLVRPVLLIDEAQEMTATVLNELRLLSSARFDSRILLTVVLAGDARLLEKLRQEELLPLGSRIRIRLALEPAPPEELLGCLRHLCAQAGNARLMTHGLMQTLGEHALGNRRVLVNTPAELLALAAEDLAQLDEQLYLDLVGEPRRGRVLLYAAEDSLPIGRERLDGITAAAGVGLGSLDLFVITATSLRLDTETDRGRLEETVRIARPRLLVLDPVVRLHAIDELCGTPHNSSHVTSPIM